MNEFVTVSESKTVTAHEIFNNNIYEGCLNGQSIPTIIIETNGIAKGGQSGSPLIDYYGNVVGVCSRGDSSASDFSKISEVQNRLQLYE